MKEPIFITGAGIICSIGQSKREVLDSLLHKESGISVAKYLKTTHTEFPVGEVHLSNEDMSNWLHIPSHIPVNRTTLLGIMAAKEAIEDAQIDQEMIRKTAFISGTTVGGMDKAEEYYKDFLHNDSRNEYIATHDCGSCSEMIADYFGDFGIVTTPSTACSSAANAIILAANMIQSGMVDIAIAGGSECLSKLHLNGFKSLMILDTEQCRPFDRTRVGLNLGEGAAYVVLESAKSVEMRKKRPLCKLTGYGNACDAFHQTASSENGEGAFRAMKIAIDNAGLLPSEIDYINAHGTSTSNNDYSESNAIKRLFHSCPPISSTKSFTGHTTSASGSIELVICILAMKNNFIPVNLNWKQPDDDAIIPVHNEHVVSMKHILCNSFGFGGNQSTLIISRL